MQDNLPEKDLPDKDVSGQDWAVQNLPRSLPYPCAATDERIRELRETLIWNARLRSTRTPRLIAQPRSAQEVASFVRFAREFGLKLSVRGSGHNYQAAALRDGGAMLDLGKINKIAINLDEKKARVGAGVSGGDLIEKLAEHGLAFPVGHCADVAMSGYLLSGGIGWNYGAWGPACRHVSAIQMVTADGELIWADESVHADLFWAAKGAGAAFFAAVTAYEVNLFPLPATSFIQEAVFAAEDASHIAHWLNGVGDSVDQSVELICLVGPDRELGEPSITLRAVTSDESMGNAREKLGKLRDLPENVSLLHPIKREELPFADLPRFSSLPSGKRVAADHIWSDAPFADLLLAVAHLAEGPQTASAISLTALGGGAPVPYMPQAHEACLSVCGVTGAGIYALWDGAENDAQHLAWVKAAETALQPLKTARYVGEADLFCARDRLAHCFTDEALLRLRALREKYDPSRLFFSVLDSERG